MAPTTAGDKPDNAILIASSTPSPSPTQGPLTRAQFAGLARIELVSKKLSPPPHRPIVPQATPSSLQYSRANERQRDYWLPGPSPEPKLPLEIQLSLFATVQKLLEEALFYWANKWVPRVLISLKWDTPLQGELNYWFRNLANYRPAVEEALEISKTQLRWHNFEDLLRSVSNARHSAVHRVERTMQTTRQILANAVRLTSSLDDPLRNKKIRELQIRLIKFDTAALKAIIAKPIEEFREEERRKHTSPSFQHNLSRGPGKSRRRSSAGPADLLVLASIETDTPQPQNHKRKPEGRREAALSPPAKRAQKIFVDLTEDSDDEYEPPEAQLPHANLKAKSPAEQEILVWKPTLDTASGNNFVYFTESADEDEEEGPMFSSKPLRIPGIQLGGRGQGRAPKSYH